MLPCYVMLDLETTGGTATRDRITEIALVRIEQGVETARWSTLVNPGVRIPPFIQQLTGINDAMVRDAPAFDEVAPTLLKLLEGAVLVAHNVRFDHGFLLQECERAGHTLKTRTLCTVRLSRKLYPQHKGHGIDALMARHGLHTSARHRAMGDVEVVLEWLRQARAELGEAALQQAATELMQGSASQPPHLETPIESLPTGPGVYLFYGEGSLPIYIGKSVNIRQRVLSHFQASARVAREMRILTEIRRIEWRETAGELGALLLESRLVKEMQPIHNRQLRRERNLCAWLLQAQPLARPALQLVRMQDIEPGQLGQLYGTYRSKKHAQDSLRELAHTHGLCPQWLGLEAGKGPCFASQIGHCRGACAGREDPALHHARLQMVLAEHRMKSWPFDGPVGIREHHTASGRTDLHVIDRWCHLATVHTMDAAFDEATARRSLAFDLDTYRLLVKRLSAPPGRDRSVISLRPALTPTDD